MNDLGLLREYADRGSEDAFAVLVRRHLDLVFSVALRQVRSPQLAEEVAQSVFADLAASASKMKPDTILTAWLYRVTRRTAVDVVRRESRRQLREQIATELTDTSPDSSDWQQIEPLLDEAMDRLDEIDRTAILLRYFEQRSLKEVGQALGASEDAAQKRVSRAVEQLREFFSRQREGISAGSLAALLSLKAVQSAPAALPAAISAAISGASVGTTAALGIAKTITMTSTQKLLVTAALFSAVGTGIYQAGRASRLDQQLQELQSAAAQIRQERDAAIGRLEAAQEQIEQLRLQMAELPRLRGEIALLRGATQELAQPKVTDQKWPALRDRAELVASLAAHVEKLKQMLAQRPELNIPELRFAKERDWVESAAEVKTETDEDLRKGLGHLRLLAKNRFALVMMRALKSYTQANNGDLPNGLSELKPFFRTAVDDSILERYKVTRTGNLKDLPPGREVLQEKAAVDDQHDALFRIGIDGAGFNSANSRIGRSYSLTEDELAEDDHAN